MSPDNIKSVDDYSQVIDHYKDLSYYIIIEVYKSS